MYFVKYCESSRIRMVGTLDTIHFKNHLATLTKNDTKAGLPRIKAKPKFSLNCRILIRCLDVRQKNAFWASERRNKTRKQNRKENQKKVYCKEKKRKR